MITSRSLTPAASGMLMRFLSLADDDDDTVPVDVERSLDAIEMDHPDLATTYYVRYADSKKRGGRRHAGP